MLTLAGKRDRTLLRKFKYTARPPSFELPMRLRHLHAEPIMAAPLASVGILSIGDMGLGIAELLIAHNYQVLTSTTGRRHVFSSARRPV